MRGAVLDTGYHGGSPLTAILPLDAPIYIGASRYIIAPPPLHLPCRGVVRRVAWFWLSDCVRHTHVLINLCFVWHNFVNHIGGWLLLPRVAGTRSSVRNVDARKINTAVHTALQVAFLRKACVTLEECTLRK
jgi:hypothetical protein